MCIMTHKRAWLLPLCWPWWPFLSCYEDQMQDAWSPCYPGCLRLMMQPIESLESHNHINQLGALMSCERRACAVLFGELSLPHLFLTKSANYSTHLQWRNRLLKTTSHFPIVWCYGFQSITSWWDYGGLLCTDSLVLVKEYLTAIHTVTYFLSQLSCKAFRALIWIHFGDKWGLMYFPCGNTPKGI